MMTSIDSDALQWLDNNELGYSIWDKKYRANNETFNEWLDRISNKDKGVRQLILEKKFLFGGRILANRGIKNRGVTMSNCYVLPAPEDNIESIYKICGEAARTFSFGGGVGIDLSNLRPCGAEVHNSAKTTTGAASFMETFSLVPETIGQKGRRGAMMLSISINHPDVEEFVTKKQNIDKVLGANISVRVSDDFMKAVEADEDYYLRYPCDAHIVYNTDELEYNKLYLLHNTYVKRIKAKELWNKIVHCAWDTGEPGILFWDRIEGWNMLSECQDFHYASTNPCGEQPLPAYGACNLGSLNLSEFVIQTSDKVYKFASDAFVIAVKIAVRALNDVLDEGQSLHPIEQQRNMVDDYRQIGLGIFGLADMLVKLQIKYSSDKARNLCMLIGRLMIRTAVLESERLAEETGKYRKFALETVLTQFLSTKMFLPELKDIEEHGLRNSQLLTIAPTGSLSTMLNVSGGIEPIFALEYTRTTKSVFDGDRTFVVHPKIVDDYMKEHGLKDISELPEWFQSSSDIGYDDRIEMQSVWQENIDASISSTINLPKNTTEDDINDLYRLAWHRGLKGVTVFRTGCRRTGILQTKNDQSDITAKRPKSLEADYYQIKVKGEQFIVLVGLLNNKPYEVFTFKPLYELSLPKHKGMIVKDAKMKYHFESEHCKFTDIQLANEQALEKSISLWASMALRHNVDIVYIVKTIRKVDDNIKSFSTAICRILSKYIPDGKIKESCPECGQNLSYVNGCKQCMHCGYSACS